MERDFRSSLVELGGEGKEGLKDFDFSKEEFSGVEDEGFWLSSVLGVSSVSSRRLLIFIVLFVILLCFALLCFVVGC
jgi:hypothetical protein